MIFAMVLVPALNAGAQTNGWEELFFKANQAFKEGRYQDAIDGYGQLVRTGYENGHIYYNLGNSYFRLNRLGQSVLNYERALLYTPRDADLNFNLRHARDQLVDTVPEFQGFISRTFFWINGLSFHEMFWGFVILNILFWGILVLRLFHHPEWTYYLFLVLLVFWLIGGFSFGLKYYKTETDDRAVILEKEVNVLSGPNIHDTVLFKLHEGTIIHFERSEDGWSLVHLTDKKRGWVKDSNIESIKISHISQF